MVDIATFRLLSLYLLYFKSLDLHF